MHLYKDICKSKSDDSIKSFVKYYYTNNEATLSNYYPGISLEFFIKVIEEYYYLEKITPSSFDFFSMNFDTYHKEFFNLFFLKLEKGIPLQYITNVSHFYKSKFYVDERCLIPRSETEILIEKTVAFINNNFDENSIVSIIDVGTGSGAILLSILSDCYNYTFNAIGSDIDDEVLNIALKNKTNLIKKINSNTDIEFVLSDRLHAFKDKKFDIIVSNPPYIKEKKDLKNVHIQVKKYEPKIALFLKDNEYIDWFMSFFKDVIYSLNIGGLFLMEGHEDHLKDLSKILEKEKSGTVKIIKDYTKRDRFISFVKEK